MSNFLATDRKAELKAQEMCEQARPEVLSPKLHLLGAASFNRPGVEMGQGEGNEKHPQPINLLLQLH